ncbi:MAG: ABC transporter permease [Acidobacteriia bacterium]|nr:ABC transporter permease [Terriglobia bacterium]
MKFELFVALRYLKAKRKQTMVSVISAISVIGITAGVMALVIALALSTGFREDIQTKIVGATSYINLLRIDNSPLLNYQDQLVSLARVTHVTGAAPAIFSQVFVASPTRNQGAVLKGVDPAREREISDFFSHIVEGDPHALEAPEAPAPADPEAPPIPGNIIVGKEMARSLGVRLGDTLQVFFPRGKLTPLAGRIVTIGEKTFRIAGIFESGLWDYDSNWAYTDMYAARRLLSLPADSASVLQFKTDNPEEVESVADAIRATAGPGFITTTWIDLNKPLFSALKLEKIALFLTISLIVFVAALNIVTTLIMMVLEKQRDIAILTAMGATQRTIMWVFMLQGLIIGLIGTTLGAVLGVGTSRILDSYKLIRLQAEVYSIPYVPFHVKTWDVVLICGTALLISFVATLYPARNASRLDPVEVLRHE